MNLITTYNPLLSNIGLKTPGIHKTINPSNWLKISQFDGGAGVEWTNSGGSIIDDAVNYFTSDKSIVISSADGVYAHVNKTITLNLSTYSHIAFRYRVDNPDNLQGLTFWFGSAADYSHSYYCNSVPKDEANAWHEVVVDKSVFSVGAGSPDWANIVRVKCRVLAKAGLTVNLTMDEIVAVKTETTRAAIIYTFADGYASLYTQARRILDKYGQSCVAFVPSSHIGSSGYITAAQARLLHQAGVEFGVHGADHQSFAGMTSAQIEQQITRCLKAFHAFGITPGSAINYPFAVYNDTVLAVARKYFSFGFIGGSSSIYLPIPLMSRMYLTGVSIGITTLLADVEAYFDTAVINKSVLIADLHDLVVSPVQSTDWSIANFEALVAYGASVDADAGVTFGWLAKKYGGC